MNIISQQPDTTQYPPWMSDSWQISRVDSFATNHGASILDSLEFPSSSSQVTTTSPVWGTLDPSTVTPTATTVKGKSQGQPFHITYSGGELSCYMDPLPSPHWGWAVASGAAVGALVGAAFGVVAGLSVLAFIAILVAAATGSAITGRRLVGVGGGGGITGTGGPPATWVANDGGAGLAAPSHPLKVASA